MPGIVAADVILVLRVPAPGIDIVRVITFNTNWRDFARHLC